MDKVNCNKLTGYNAGEFNRIKTRIVNEHYHYLTAFAIKKLKGHEFAEDLVHDALLSAFKMLDTFCGCSSERTWLTGILKNKIYIFLRKERAISYWDHHINEEPIVKKSLPIEKNCNGENCIVAKELRALISKGIALLNEPARSVFYSRFVLNRKPKKLKPDLLSVMQIIGSSAIEVRRLSKPILR